MSAAAERDRLRAALEEVERKALAYASNANAQKRGSYNDLAGIAHAALSNTTQPDPVREAAPDLLFALQMAKPALEWCQKQWTKSPQQGDGVNVLAVVEAAIAKAGG